MNELSTNKTNKPSKQKKWTHLQKYEESVGKFQSLLTKCSIKAQKQPHSNQNQSNFSQNQSNIKQTLIFKLISSIEKVSEVIGEIKRLPSIKEESLQILNLFLSFLLNNDVKKGLNSKNTLEIFIKQASSIPNLLSQSKSQMETLMIPIENIEKTFSDLNNLKKAYALYSQSLPKKELTIVQSLLSFLEISIEYYRYLNKSNSSNDGNINVIIKKNYGNILENIENNNNNNSPTGKNNNIMENIGSSNDKLTIDKEINNPHMNNIANTNNINKEKSVSVDSFSQDKAIINPNASAIIEEIKYTNLNRSIAFQFLKDFKDLKLMRPTLKNHRVLNTSLQLNNSKNQNASLNLESVFEDLRRKQKEIPFVKKEIIAVESQNSRLIWKDERERRSREKIKELEEFCNVLNDTFSKDSEFQVKKILETSKQKKNLLEKNKKEALTLKNLKKINQIKENSQIKENFLENRKDSIWRKKELEKERKIEIEKKKERSNFFSEMREIKEKKKNDEMIKKKDDILRYKLESLLNEDLKYKKLLEKKEKKKKELNETFRNNDKHKYN